MIQSFVAENFEDVDKSLWPMRKLILKNFYPGIKGAMFKGWIWGSVCAFHICWKTVLTKWKRNWFNRNFSSAFLEWLVTQTKHNLPRHQCDQMVRLFFNIWPFAAMKISPIISQMCKSMLIICQIRRRLSKIWQILANFCQSDKISPNLVTL